MVSIVLIEDNDAHAELFELKLKAIDGLTFDVRRFHGGRDLLSQIDELSPQIAFIDYRLGDVDGVELVGTLRGKGVTWPIVVLTGQGDEYVAAAITRAGADDYLIKDDLEEPRLIEVLDRALALHAERFKSLEVKSELLKRLDTLTARELEVLDSIMAGKTNKEIASDFSRSIKTIKIHRSRVMSKMQAQTPAELARLVMLARE